MTDKPMLYTDLDGVLLDLPFVVKTILEDIVGLNLPEPWCSSFEEAYGVSDAVLGYPTDPPSDTWRAIYAQVAPPYGYAQAFVKNVREVYRVIGLSHRVGAIAEAASRRDLDRAGLEFDDLIYVESSNAKLEYLAPGVTYLEDHPRYAANAADTGARVFLISRPYNGCAADYAYRRARGLAELEATLLQEMPLGEEEI